MLNKQFWKIVFGIVALNLIFGAAIPIFSQINFSDKSDFSRFLDQTNGMTVDEGVAFALANNDELQAMLKEAEAVKALINQAEQRARPSIGVESRQQVNGGNSRLMTQAMIPLELGGRRAARITVAQKEAEVRLQTFYEKERQLAAEVRIKFGETLAKIFKLKLLEEILDATLQSYQLVQARVKEGKTAPLEENMMLVEVNRLRSMRETADGEVQISVFELKNLLGKSPEESLLLRGEFDDLVRDFPPLAQAITKALLNRPDINFLRSVENLETARIEQAKTEGKYDANISFGYERMSNDFLKRGDNMLIFGFNVQLPFANRNRASIESSVLNREAAEKRREFAELMIKREVASAYTRYEQAVKSLEIYRVGVINQASQNLDVVRQTYELGAKSLLDYIAEQRRFLELENDFIDAKLNVYLAKVEILKTAYSPELKGK